MSKPVQGRAMTNEAKRHIVERLYTLWTQLPYLRLGQLIISVDKDPYWREDEDLLTTLEQFYADKFDNVLARDARNPSSPLRRMARETQQQIANGETEEGGFGCENEYDKAVGQLAEHLLHDKSPAELKHILEDAQQAPYAAHYKGYPFEPVDIAEAYQLNFNEGNIVKYLLRWRKKDGIKDLRKARYYIERLIGLEERRLQEAGE